MNIEELFAFLINEYKLTYRYQAFSNCYGGNWMVDTHSFFNESGCFTIQIIFQREINFWYSSQFSTEMEELCESGINVSLTEPQIWAKHEKLLFFKNPFFWDNYDKVLIALAEVLKTHLEKNNEFFGIQV